MEDLSKFQSITKNSQLKGLLPHDVRDVFSGVVLNYTAMDQYIHLDYEIVNNPSFESGLVNILNKAFSSMSILENMATIGPKTITGGEDVVVPNNAAPAYKLSYSELFRKSMLNDITEENGGSIDC